MRPLFKIAIVALNLILLVIFTNPIFGAGITNGYPGYPGVWDELTTNTIIQINLDSPVAMIGNQPDVSYCVKKMSISGFDYVFTDVACDVDASDDRLSVRLYPQELLDPDSQFAYKVIGVNFSGGGSVQNFNRCFNTGNNPSILLGTTVSEIEMCSDGGSLITGGFFCYRCHTNWLDPTGETDPFCVITPLVPQPY